MNPIGRLPHGAWLDSSMRTARACSDRAWDAVYVRAQPGGSPMNDSVSSRPLFDTRALPAIGLELGSARGAGSTTCVAGIADITTVADVPLSENSQTGI